jgi:hypothetical protein
MAERQRWNPVPSVVYGVAFGALAGSLVIWGTNGGDWWQDQAGALLNNNVDDGCLCGCVLCAAIHFKLR